jgi:branched-chain amino acid aminotransferase
MSTQLFPTLVNGQLSGPGMSVVSTDDPGFLLGLSVFETMLYEHGCVHFIEQHLARLADGCRVLGVEVAADRAPERGIETYLPALDARLAELGEESAALRLTVTRGAPGAGATVVVAARTIVPPPAEGAVLTWEPNAKHSDDSLEQIKSTSRMRNVLAREDALSQGAWDALFGNERGDVCEATIANVWAVVDEITVTPDLASGCLGGVTRECLLMELSRTDREVRVGPLPVADLARASEVFLTNSTGRVIPVRAVLGVVDGLAGSAGPVACELRKVMQAAEERYRAGPGPGR